LSPHRSDFGGNRSCSSHSSFFTHVSRSQAKSNRNNAKLTGEILDRFVEEVKSWILGFVASTYTTLHWSPHVRMDWGLTSFHLMIWKLGLAVSYINLKGVRMDRGLFLCTDLQRPFYF
jgi:hypothetical protein